jgi:hypothetical protein
LDIEERAELIADIDRNEEGGAVGNEGMGSRRPAGASCRRKWCDIGPISIMVTVVLTLTGVVLLVLARTLVWPIWVDRLSQYFISAGVFGLASGGTNAIAVLLLLYKVPFICGSG